MSKELEIHEVTREFLSGFADEKWKLIGESTWTLESEDGKEYVVFSDLGFEGAEDSSMEMALYKENDQTYVLQQEVDDGVISFRLIVPPYKDEYFNPRDSWNGVVYGPDGRMETNRNVKGLPKRIDMDKTVELFLKQVIEKDFSKPVLVRA
ncbi:TPA: hypothetical protein DCP77_01465 [Candidatus Collierbacteria bacterium]|uniref:Uncharacterized protein n=1 Tax=Candidatus Collierbacteria bacterium GW2011_GWA2_42_17 TaxID=1618378 RepID=A0A0G1B9J1_9BACT|nr:MAG: hypothetical protein UU94_C0003G0061 [Candidatus Collierbacteria bacterium GW2011_GWB2_42_12]KKS43001.1 MAG: hypothetical protein UV06_C0003G0002 [Candidatus Collierbacteria bacterium GW2011_GWA2_42_17]KKS62530.1 MAG: hypothetical protein UV28_C0009G0006 [Candidatus Collierbacteria bacterium GW2011_GWE2_42_48]KKS62668.1 MAG: hypothetical protein UV29_C0012G0021 [Candidatus Collierbacteria bacterium GW2011_GWD2_42_50]KKS64849.1 MAG: hypothetical protein UV32_C0005G0020 [Candidatus Collie